MKHVAQTKALDDQTRFQIWLAGRRGGKTTGILEKVCEKISMMPPKSDIWYIGPTNQDALETLWDEADERFYELDWKPKPLISKQRFMFPGRRRFILTGAEKIRRIRGKRSYHVFLDEFAFYEKPLDKIWRAVRPSLSDLRGGATLATTPVGKLSQAYDFYRASLTKSNWSYHHWKTIDNPYIDPEEIEEAKMELDEKSFAQEYLAEWISFEGLAYYNFSENTHIKKQPEFDDSLPVIMHLDFNVNPTTLVLAQKDNSANKDNVQMLRYKKEYSFPNSSTEDTLNAFVNDYRDKAGTWHIKIRGDAAGHSRKSTTGYSDYKYVHEILSNAGFDFEHQVPAANPPIVDRVRNVNGYLKNVKGLHRVEFDPQCEDTIKDLSSQPLEGRFPSSKNNLGHKADAVGYGINFEYLESRKARQRTIQL